VVYNDIQGPIPVAVLKQQDTISLDLKNTDIEIVPTVFITNTVFENIKHSDVENLVDKITRKVDVIFRRNCESFNGDLFPYKEIQIDCDWTESSKKMFFYFLKKLREKKAPKKISATIRLYQFKYPEKAGVPPADKGMLMCYNLSNLKDISVKNSILDINELKKYLVNSKTYSIPLDVALPVFSWGLVFQNKQFKDIYRNMSREDAEKLSFLKKNTNDYYQVMQDTVYQNIYLRMGDQLRIEEVSTPLLLQTTQLLKPLSDKEDLTISFFHLDENLIRKYKSETFEDIYSAF
jgi:hypothetical protein